MSLQTPGAKMPSQVAAERERERQLVLACAAGDSAAWQKFYQAYRRVVIGVARRQLRRLGVADVETLAEDVLAEVFSELLARERATLKSFAGRSSVSTWLAVLARRCASRLVRQKRRAPQQLAEPERLEAVGESPSDMVEQQERQSLVRAQMEQLSPRDRLALQLFYQGGRSYKEVAEVLKLPVENIGTLLARARQRLAERLGVLAEGA